MSGRVKKKGKGEKKEGGEIKALCSWCRGKED